MNRVVISGEWQELLKRLDKALKVGTPDERKVVATLIAKQIKGITLEAKGGHESNLSWANRGILSQLRELLRRYHLDLNRIHSELGNHPDPGPFSESRIQPYFAEQFGASLKPVSRQRLQKQ